MSANKIIKGLLIGLFSIILLTLIFIFTTLFIFREFPDHFIKRMFYYKSQNIYAPLNVSKYCKGFDGPNCPQNFCEFSCSYGNNNRGDSSGCNGGCGPKSLPF